MEKVNFITNWAEDRIELRLLNTWCKMLPLMAEFLYMRPMFNLLKACPDGEATVSSQDVIWREN